MENIVVQIDSDGFALVTMSIPGRAANTLATPVTRQLERVMDELSGSAAIRGVVLTSGKAKEFCSGADLAEVEDEIASCQAARTPEELHRAGEHLWRISRLLRKLECCGKPVVAAINGSALGGGLELALACHYRIVADQPGIQLGFPEVTLGLIPGAGGTQRLPRLIGIQAALPLLLEGKTVAPARALQLGFVHAVCAPEALLVEAKRWLTERGDPVAPWDRKEFKLPGGTPYSPTGMYVMAGAIAGVQGGSYGNYPAQENILKAVYEGALVSIDAALRIEACYSLETVRKPQAKAMVRTLFKSMRSVAKGSSRPTEPPAIEVKKVAVLGAGLMGAGIAHVQALAGIETVLIDVDQATAERGKAYSLGLLEQAVARGKMTAVQSSEIADRIRPTTDYAAIAGAELIIEAVFEERAAKAEVTSGAMRFAGPNTVFGSNTSSLPIDGLADASPRPEAFVGIHFFSPVDRMRLVEVIVGRRTGPAAVAMAIDYALKVGKVPIVVNDKRAFYTSRVFGIYLAEGFTMLAEGIAPAIIENAGRMMSMPRGPLELGDDVGLDVLYRADKQAAADLGDLHRSRPEERVVASLVEQGRHGRKTRTGFYDYPANGGPKSLWPGLAGFATPAGEAVDAALLTDIKDRLLYRQAIEAVRCMEEEVITDPCQADVGAILGWGFPQWTGGPFSFVDGAGMGAFIARAETLCGRYGSRFEPPRLLRRMAAAGQRFY